MNIVTLTNTYLPHVGGVARSVDAFVTEFRKRGHRVLVVAPEFADQIDNEKGVVRIPAIQNFNGSDFSMALPVSGLLTDELNRFQPDIVHAHHPFLLGMTALRIARYRELPLVFTHHTLYERYTHYVPADSETLRRFVIELATRYGNLANQVFAPSESIANLLRKRGVTSPIAVVPTGVYPGRFANGDGKRFRIHHNIPETAFVVGHLGRLAPEKNLLFLAKAVARFLQKHRHAHFLLAGSGPMEQELEAIFREHGLAQRFHSVGVQRPDQQNDAYHAMDVFAFASKSETQGMVLTEAMAAGVPVVALNANGAREVVCDGKNGRLPRRESPAAFAAALDWVIKRSPDQYQTLQSAARQTASQFSMANSADRALTCYQHLLAQPYFSEDAYYHEWLRLGRLIQAEWEILEGIAGATGSALRSEQPPSGPD